MSSEYCCEKCAEESYCMGCGDEEVKESQNGYCVPCWNEHFVCEDYELNAVIQIQTWWRFIRKRIYPNRSAFNIPLSQNGRLFDLF